MGIIKETNDYNSPGVLSFQASERERRKGGEGRREGEYICMYMCRCVVVGIACVCLCLYAHTCAPVCCVFMHACVHMCVCSCLFFHMYVCKRLH